MTMVIMKIFRKDLCSAVDKQWLICIYMKNLKCMKSFTYPGSKVNSSAFLDDKIINRIVKALSVFGKLCHCLWNEFAVKLDKKFMFHLNKAFVCLQIMDSVHLTGCICIP